MVRDRNPDGAGWESDVPADWFLAQLRGAEAPNSTLPRARAGVRAGRQSRRRMAGARIQAAHTVVVHGPLDDVDDAAVVAEPMAADTAPKTPATESDVRAASDPESETRPEPASEDESLRDVAVEPQASDPEDPTTGSAVASTPTGASSFESTAASMPAPVNVSTPVSDDASTAEPANASTPGPTADSTPSSDDASTDASSAGSADDPFPGLDLYSDADPGVIDDPVSDSAAVDSDPEDGSALDGPVLTRAWAEPVSARSAVSFRPAMPFAGRPHDETTGADRDGELGRSDDLAGIGGLLAHPAADTDVAHDATSDAGVRIGSAPSAEERLADERETDPADGAATAPEEHRASGLLEKFGLRRRKAPPVPAIIAPVRVDDSETLDDAEAADSTESASAADTVGADPSDRDEAITPGDSAAASGPAEAVASEDVVSTASEDVVSTPDVEIDSTSLDADADADADEDAGPDADADTVVADEDAGPDADATAVVVDHDHVAVTDEDPAPSEPDVVDVAEEAVISDDFESTHEVVSDDPASVVENVGEDESPVDEPATEVEPERQPDPVVAESDLGTVHADLAVPMESVATTTDDASTAEHVETETEAVGELDTDAPAGIDVVAPEQPEAAGQVDEAKTDRDRRGILSPLITAAALLVIVVLAMVGGIATIGNQEATPPAEPTNSPAPSDPATDQTPTPAPTQTPELEIPLTPTSGVSEVPASVTPTDPNAAAPTSAVPESPAQPTQAPVAPSPEPTASVEPTPDPTDPLVPADDGIEDPADDGTGLVFG